MYLGFRTPKGPEDPKIWYLGLGWLFFSCYSAEYVIIRYLDPKPFNSPKVLNPKPLGRTSNSTPASRTLGFDLRETLESAGNLKAWTPITQT